MRSIDFSKALGGMNISLTVKFVLFTFPSIKKEFLIKEKKHIQDTRPGKHFCGVVLRNVKITNNRRNK